MAASLAAALAIAGCTAGSSGNDAAKPSTSSSAAPSVQASGTVTLWHFFTDRESKAIQSVVDDFQAANPGIKVMVKERQDDEKMRQAIAAGQGPDDGLSYSTDIVGNFCGTGAFVDLAPYIQRDKVDMSQLPQTVRSYTEYKGTRCAMPFLSDTYGLYYNKQLLADAGYSQPLKTVSELATMAKKLTKRSANGDIQRRPDDHFSGQPARCSARAVRSCSH